MTDNSEEVIQLLRRRVHNDPELQAHLFAISDLDEFITAVSELARASGLQLKHEDVRQAMYTGRRAWFDSQRL